jgi:hypothetical protein
VFGQSDDSTGAASLLPFQGIIFLIKEPEKENAYTMRRSEMVY